MEPQLFQRIFKKPTADTAILLCTAQPCKWSTEDYTANFIRYAN